MKRPKKKTSKKAVPQTKWLVSVHSQKGGVGKTLIALYLARRFAQAAHGGLGQRTVLIDADLTGTSIAEGLPLCAPTPSRRSFSSLSKTGTMLKQEGKHRDEYREWPDPEKRQIKFVNDLLTCDPILFEEVTAAKEPDGFRRHHLLWRIDDSHVASGGGIEQLRIIPSSGIPRHIAQSVPHVYKEHSTGFLETRLTEIVASLWSNPWDAKESFDVVVIDTPPVLRGVSKAVLALHKSIVVRLDDRTDLKNVAIFVGSADVQDLIALGRAVDSLLHEEWVSPDRRSADREFLLDAKKSFLVLNRIPPVEVDLSGTSFILDDRPKVVHYYRSRLNMFHAPSTPMLKGTRITQDSFLEILDDTSRTFVILKDPGLEGTFVDSIHSRMVLSSPSVHELEDLFKGVANV